MTALSFCFLLKKSPDSMCCRGRALFDFLFQRTAKQAVERISYCRTEQVQDEIIDVQTAEQGEKLDQLDAEHCNRRPQHRAPKGGGTWEDGRDEEPQRHEHDDIAEELDDGPHPRAAPQIMPKFGNRSAG